MKYFIVSFTLVVSGLLFLSHQRSLPTHDNSEWLDANELPPVTHCDAPDNAKKPEATCQLDDPKAVK